MKRVTAEVRAMTDAQLEQYELKGEVTVAGHLLSGEDILVKKSPKKQEGGDKDKDNVEVGGEGDLLVALDFTLDEDITQMALCREVANRVQKARKAAGLKPDDDVKMYVDAKGSAKLTAALGTKQEYLFSCLKRPLALAAATDTPNRSKAIFTETYQVDGADLEVILVESTE
eukprot:GHVU01023809.1.p3 GENE.GHVU01023809.1~~GHVU01023809.1.p3  ORF type:complete len:172 (+),score=50.71 GHVU01023809.1:3-518(+)